MKLLIINDLASGGGVERVMQDLAFHLCKSGSIPTILCLNSTRKEMRKVLHAPLRCISLSPIFRRGLRYRLMRKLNAFWHRLHLYWLKRQRWDVVIAIKEGPSLQLAAKLNAVRKFGWVHVDYQYLYWTRSVFGSAEAERKVMQCFDAIICVSNAAAKSVCRVIGDPGNLCVRYNPLHVDQIRNKAKQPLSEQKNIRPLFVAVGRLDAPKNFELLIRSAAKILKRKNFELHIIGDGPQRHLLQAIIQQEHVEHNIKLLGAKQNPYPHIQQADWFVSTSICESYGLAIQEALILGVPVIATRCPAIEEVCDPRFCIITDNEETAFTKALDHVLQHPELAVQYRENIRDSYHGKQELYTDRLQLITELWERLSNEQL